MSARHASDLQAARDNYAPGPEAVPADLPSMAIAVLDCMTEGVTVITAEGIVVYTNAAEYQMVSYERGELEGCHARVRTAWPGESPPEVAGAPSRPP